MRPYVDLCIHSDRHEFTYESCDSMPLLHPPSHPHLYEHAGSDYIHTTNFMRFDTIRELRNCQSMPSFRHVIAFYRMNNLNSHYSTIFRLHFNIALLSSTNTRIDERRRRRSYFSHIEYALPDDKKTIFENEQLKKECTVPRFIKYALERRKKN